MEVIIMFRNKVKRIGNFVFVPNDGSFSNDYAETYVFRSNGDDYGVILKDGSVKRYKPTCKPIMTYFELSHKQYNKILDIYYNGVDRRVWDMMDYISYDKEIGKYIFCFYNEYVK
jgi:hypothetical protein